MRTGTELVAHFWSKVDRNSDPTGCWPWLAGKSSDGYGQFDLNGKGVKPHRLAFVLTNGAIPAGLFVCHRCDNRGCCRPSHLFLGTPADNTADMVDKGRNVCGRAKLTPGQVRKIYAARGTQREIGLRFGVSQSNVSAIKLGKIWRQLTTRGVAT